MPRGVSVAYLDRGVKTKQTEQCNRSGPPTREPDGARFVWLP